MAPVLPISRIAIIGAGHVGATTAYALMLRAIVREIVLIDHNPELARAEAQDLQDANALARPAQIWAGSYADAAAAGIAVITAGSATHGSQSRLSMAEANAGVVEASVAQLTAAGFDGIMIVASNPVDLMSLVAFQESGLPSARVIGTGTLLDTSRLRKEIAGAIGAASGAVDGMVLGEHGDSEIVVFSTLRVGGLDLEDFALPESLPDRQQVAGKVRQAAYEIIGGKGYTSFGIATAIVRLCEAITRNEKAVLPVSTYLTGQLGIEGVYMSLPCVLGTGGVERVLVPPLSNEEREGLRQSGAILQEAAQALGARARGATEPRDGRDPVAGEPAEVHSGNHITSDRF